MRSQSKIRWMMLWSQLLLTVSGVSHASDLPEKYSDDSEVEMMGKNSLWQNPRDCGPMGVWDVAMVMCMPLASPDMPMSMLMIHGNLYGSRVWQEGPRGRSDYFSTHMVMVDWGRSFGDSHYLNVDLMMTSELWSVPSRGYPLLMQIGERDHSGKLYLDAQHPHSSPIMGMTFSDTIRLNSDHDFLKIFFSPRGESTDGPIAFMHRLTGIVNPNAPLGHHVGQDVGHISSTVVGSSLKFGKNRFELSALSGVEPQPAKVDLPLYPLDSVAVRWIREFSPDFIAMISFANLASRHESSEEKPSQQRVSFSFYQELKLKGEWKWNQTFIYGGVSHTDETPFLSSFLDEFLLRDEVHRFWGRLELLQRTAAELQIEGQLDSHHRQWVSALTLGYSRRIFTWQGSEFTVGTLATKNLVPQSFKSAYQGDPWSTQVFIQWGGMQMWHLSPVQ